MYERFTDKARKVLQLANQEAQLRNHEYLGTEHILLGLEREGNSIAAQVLSKLGIGMSIIRREVEKLLASDSVASGSTVTSGKLPQTPRVKKAIEFAMEEARNLKHDYVGSEHLLLGLLRDSESFASALLTSLGVNIDQVRSMTLEIRR